MRFVLLASLLMTLAGVSDAAKVEVREVPSKSMNKQVPATIITPDAYPAGKKTWPVLYLLHGFGDNHTGWNARTDIARLADQYKIIVVCPDGNGDSWYFDLPSDPTCRYETHIASEVVSFVDAHYRTMASPRGRAITGVSMGGHGGLYLGFRHQDVFGACGSTSGGVDFRGFADNWNLKQRLGSPTDHADDWTSHTVLGNLDKLTKDSTIAIIFDCGTEDFFIAPNRALHQALLEKGIPHDYTERPGGHAWPYWQNSIQYQFLFFHNFFETPAETPAKSAK